MVFNLSILQQYLLHEHGILPERVGWHTCLRQDLPLTDTDIQILLEKISSLMDSPFSIDNDHHLTDVLDLMVYVLLRSTEETDIAFYFNSSDQPFDFIKLPCMTSDFRQVS